MSFKVPAFPVLDNAGDMTPFMSHKDREHMAWALWEEAGGHERAADLLRKDPEKFWEATKELVFKRLPRPVTNVAVTADSVEALLARLDAGEHAQVIEGAVNASEEVSE